MDESQIVEKPPAEEEAPKEEQLPPDMEGVEPAEGQ